MKTMILPSLALLVAACAGETVKEEAPLRLGQTSEALSLVPRGATCQSLGLGGQSITLPAPQNGRYALDSQNGLNFDYYDDSNTVFKFTQSTLRITGVMASIGQRTLVWEMPEGQDAYGSLHGPPDPTTGLINTPEEVTFCWDYALRVQPSPYAFHAQKPAWTITKTGLSTPLVLAEGQEEDVEYSVTVSSAGTPVSAGQYISGPVFVTNGSPHTVTVGAVRTKVGTIDAVVTCPTPAPFALAPFAQQVCEFRADLPDTADRTVVGSADVSHALKVTTQEVVASFGAHNVTTDTLDDCIAIHDPASPTNDHFVGTACINEGPKTFTFTSEVGPFGCGPFAVTTAATYTGLETGATGSASWTVNGKVQCRASCTLGAPYWRNHSQASPRRYNPIWNQIGPQGELTTFFRSGGTYLNAITKPIQGNAYWTAARAYIAATLNVKNGATMTSANTTAYNNATNLFNTYTPAQVDSNNATRKLFVKAAADLKDYNSGRTGPGRCTSKPDLSDSDD